MPKAGSEGHGKSGHLSDRLRRKAPRRYFTFAFTEAGFAEPEAGFLDIAKLEINSRITQDSRV